MSFLKKIFKAKEGGTLVGNLIRGSASSLTGGLLGQGVMNQAMLAKQNQNQPVLNASAGALNNALNVALGGALETKEGQKIASEGAKMGIAYYIEKYKLFIMGVLVTLGVYFAFLASKVGVKKYRVTRRR